MMKQQTLGFGFNPEEAQQHFLVVSYPINHNKKVYVYERFVWDEDSVQTSELNGEGKNRLKIALSQKKWEMVKGAIEREFNVSLKEENKKVGHFKVGQVPVERLLGKEMLVLLWAIEECDPVVIPNAIKNWLGLSREERWWLFTMTNAATGDADNVRGWRIALRYAITDNPVSDKVVNLNLFDALRQESM